MRVLVVSNLYPPYYVGGYEVGCRDVVERLKRRGHKVEVLTSTYGLNREESSDGVHRSLTALFEKIPPWESVILKESANQTAFLKVCLSFKPDCVFFWNLSHSSVSLAALARRAGLSTCCYISDNWLATWRMDHWYQLWNRRFIKGQRFLRFVSKRFGLVAPPDRLDFPSVLFASGYLKSVAEKAGLDVGHAVVVPWGVDVDRFSYRPAVDCTPARLLYVGQIRPHKGIHAAIRALGVLVNNHRLDNMTLTIVGDTSGATDYVAHLKKLAVECGAKLSFSGHVDRETLPELYRSHDIFVLPSEWDEPFGIVSLEAMSCGLAVVSTKTGGSAEIFVDGENALIYPPREVSLCAQQIVRLVRDPVFYGQLRENGRKTVEERYHLEGMIDSVERELHKSLEEVVVKGERSTIRTSNRYDGLAGVKQQATSKRCVAAWIFVLRALRFMSRTTSLDASITIRTVFQQSMALATRCLFPLFWETAFFLLGRRWRRQGHGWQSAQRVLVVQMADIGDVVLTAPFLRGLRNRFPDARITMVVQPSIKNLVERCPYVNDVISFNWRSVESWRVAVSGHFYWWFQGGWFVFRRLRSFHDDLAISPRWNSDSCQAASIILMYLSGARWRMGYLTPSRTSSRLSLENLLTDGPARGFPGHEVNRQAEFLRFLGGSIDDRMPEVWIDKEDGLYASRVLEAHGVGVGDRLVAISPGAAWPLRRWPPERFVELGCWLDRMWRAWIVILGHESEADLGKKIEAGLRGARTINLVGKTSLRQMAAVVSCCDLFLGSDSGPMHIAAATGVATIGLFGSGEYERFRPLGSNSEGVRLGLLCSPCWENCMFDRAYCMEGITVDQVKAAISEKMGSFYERVA